MLVSHALGSSAVHDSTRAPRSAGASDARDRKTLVSAPLVLAPVRSSRPPAIWAGATLFDETGFDETGFDETGFDEAGFDEAGFDETGFDEAGFDEIGLDSGDERSTRGRTSCSSRAPMVKEPWGDDRKEARRPRAPRSPRT